MIEIKHLETLLTLEATSSVVETARRLCLTQSAVSHQIVDLEARLGTKLFKRKSKPIKFSESGKRMLLLAKEVIPKVRKTERDIQQIRSGKQGKLALSMDSSSYFQWLMPTISAYRDMWSEIQLDFNVKKSDILFGELENFESDLVITTHYEENDTLVFIPVLHHEIEIATSVNHDFVSKQFVTLDDIEDQTLITIAEDSGTEDNLLYLLNASKRTPKSLVTVEWLVYQVG